MQVPQEPQSLGKWKGSVIATQEKKELCSFVLSRCNMQIWLAATNMKCCQCHRQKTLKCSLSLKQHVRLCQQTPQLNINLKAWKTFPSPLGMVSWKETWKETYC